MLRLLSKRRLRPILLGGTVALIIMEIVALSPASIEENESSTAPVEMSTLIPEEEQTTLADGIPKNKLPEYSVDRFNYVSTQGGEKQWNLIADKAFFYYKDNIVHSRAVKANLYDPDGKVTVVTGKEAKYLLRQKQKDLEVFGNVVTIFPDGFELHSEYLLYHPDTRKIEIPTKYFVQGFGHEQTGQNINFDSNGLDFAMASSVIVLPEKVKMTMERTKPKSAESQGVPDVTTIYSDHCLIYRTQHMAYFTMNPKRPLSSRFVHIVQPTLFTRGRRADLNYGDFSDVLEYLVAYDDVLIKETAKEDGSQDTSLRYATGGRADFDTRRDVIVLTKFPQAYQDNDTVTGDIIIVHRDTDIVEVEHSNAFSQGNQN